MVASSEVEDSDVDDEPVRRKKPTHIRDAVEEAKTKSRKNNVQHVRLVADKGTKRGCEKVAVVFQAQE